MDRKLSLYISLYINDIISQFQLLFVLLLSYIYNNFSLSRHLIMSVYLLCVGGNALQVMQIM